MTAILITKYPIKVGQTLFPKGTEIRQATLEEMQRVWPGITYKESDSIGVWFPLMAVPTIVHRSQIEEPVQAGR
jgi:hypothetical protein